MSIADSPAGTCSTPVRRPGHALLVASLGATVLLSACAPQNRTTHTSLPVYAADQAGGAHTCTTTPLTPPLMPGKPSSATMSLSNDGGWCAVSVHQDGPAPYTAGLLTTRSEHGKVYVHSVGDETRIDYTPEQHFGGNDSFVVTLVPGDSTVRVAALVAAPPEPPPVVAPPAKPVPRKPIRKKPIKKTHPPA